jgi:hypothetical protein
MTHRTFISYAGADIQAGRDWTDELAHALGDVLVKLEQPPNSDYTYLWSPTEGVVSGYSTEPIRSLA